MAIVHEVVDDFGALAFGATVRDTAGDVRFRRDVHAASRDLSGTEPTGRSGFEIHSEVEDVTVRWLDGRELEVGPLGGGHDHRIAPPSVEATPPATVP